MNPPPSIVTNPPPPPQSIVPTIGTGTEDIGATEAAATPCPSLPPQGVALDK